MHEILRLFNQTIIHSVACVVPQRHHGASELRTFLRAILFLRAWVGYGMYAGMRQVAVRDAAEQQHAAQGHAVVIHDLGIREQ